MRRLTASSSHLSTDRENHNGTGLSIDSQEGEERFLAIEARVARIERAYLEIVGALLGGASVRRRVADDAVRYATRALRQRELRER